MSPTPTGKPTNDPGAQLKKLQQRWLELPLSYRVNALLYFLGAIALLWLGFTLFTGGSGSSHQIQVGAGATTTTAKGRVITPSTFAPLTAPTAAGSATTLAGVTSTVGGGTISVPATLGSTTTAGSSGGGGGGSGGGGGGTTNTTGSTVATTTTTSPPQQTTTTGGPTLTTISGCHNSGDSRCGTFSWSPAPDTNQPLTVTVSPRPANPRAGDTVFFDVTADDPDHPVDINCSLVRTGDGGATDGPCTTPPNCPAHYGPWTPPAKEPGHYTATFTHVYSAAGTYTAKFTFRSWSQTTCTDLDPYANEGSFAFNVTIAP